jgi:hypothetical protein
MKFVFAIAAIAMSASVFATDFTAKFEEVDCKISNGNVTRTMTFGKDNKVSATETSTVSFEGLTPVIEKAVAQTSGRPSRSWMYSFSVTHEGQTHLLNPEDSNEALLLIKLLQRVCR